MLRLSSPFGVLLHRCLTLLLPAHGKVADVGDDDIVIRHGGDGRRTGVAVGEELDVELLVRKTLFEHPPERVGKDDLAVGQRGAFLLFATPAEGELLAIRMIFGEAVLAHTVAEVVAVILTDVENTLRGIDAKLLLHLGEPLLPDLRVRLAELGVVRSGMRTSCAVWLEGEELGVRLRIFFPPVAEAVAAIDLHGVELQALHACPFHVRAFLVITQFELGEKPRPCPDLRMIVLLHRRDADGCLLEHVVLTRPEPAHAQLIPNEGINRIRCAILLLHACLRAQPALRLHVLRVPAVAPGDHHMLFISRDDDLFRMFEIEVHLRKQCLHFRLHADPDRAVRRWRRRTEHHERLFPADLLDVTRHHLRRSPRARRSVGRDDDRQRGRVLRGEDEIGGIN